MVEFGTAQRLVWENKLAKGFGTTDVPLEFCLLQSEVTGVDLGTAVEAKMARNASRRYRTRPGGAFVKEEPDRE